jgi:hypothetical protein
MIISSCTNLPSRRVLLSLRAQGQEKRGKRLLLWLTALIAAIDPVRDKAIFSMSEQAESRREASR